MRRCLLFVIMSLLLVPALRVHAEPIRVKLPGGWDGAIPDQKEFTLEIGGLPAGTLSAEVTLFPVWRYRSSCPVEPVEGGVWIPSGAITASSDGRSVATFTIPPQPAGATLCANLRIVRPMTVEEKKLLSTALVPPLSAALDTLTTKSSFIEEDAVAMIANAVTTAVRRDPSLARFASATAETKSVGVLASETLVEGDGRAALTDLVSARDRVSDAEENLAGATTETARQRMRKSLEEARAKLEVATEKLVFDIGEQVRTSDLFTPATGFRSTPTPAENGYRTIGPDAGIGAFTFGQKAQAWDVAPYVGIVWYPFTEIDRNVPLAQADGFDRRFAVVAGAPINDLSIHGRNVHGVVAGHAVMLGAGLRLDDLIRVTGGVTIFKTDDSNPLSRDQPIETGAFVTFSTDTAVYQTLKKAFGDLGSGGS